MWFIVTIAPGLFSGISAVMLLVPLVGSLYFSSSQPAPWGIWAMDAFGLLSALSVLILLKYRYIFLRQPQSRQRAWAGAAWAVHVGAFALLIAFLLRQ